MTQPARQPQGIPAGGQFAPDIRTEPTIGLSPERDRAVHTAPLTGTIELHNDWFDKLPEWPSGMPEPEINFGFDNGKVETYVTVDGKMLTFWDSDGDGVINDTDTGSDNPWEDFEEADQEAAKEWGNQVHTRIDSATYGVMIEGSHSPAVKDIILAQALGKDPAPAKTAPDLADTKTRNAYVIAASERLAAANHELQNVYMIGAAQELRTACPAIDSFELTVDERGRLEIAAAWDADGNYVGGEAVYAASHEVFRYRNEDDFNTFLDGRTINVGEAIGFRPAG